MILDYLEEQENPLASQSARTDLFSPDDILAGTNIVDDAVSGRDDDPPSPQNYSNDVRAKPTHTTDLRNTSWK